MSFESAWEWAGSLPSAPPGEICAQCHDCRIFYEPIAERVIRALELTRSQGRYYGAPSLAPPRVDRAEEILYAKLTRLKRISGLYARSFQRLENLGVHIPFVGTAAFTSNLVGWELERQFAPTLGLHPDWSDPLQNQNVPRPPIGLGIVAGTIVRRSSFPAFWTTLQQVFDGNAVVFVEIFAIIDFVIRHIERFGRPQQNDLSEFEVCLRNFINWWDEVQPSNRQIPEMTNIEVDRNDLILQGIMMCLRGDGLNGSKSILQNEQLFTLQEYMYNLIDRGIIDEMEIGLQFDGYNVASRFAYDLSRKDIPERYVVPYKGRGLFNWTWITEAADRMPYAAQVVQRFNDLYYGNDADRQYLAGEHARLAGDANGY